MLTIRRLQSSISDKTAEELVVFQAAKNAANIEYLAMMTDVDIDEEEESDDEQEI